MGLEDLFVILGRSNVLQEQLANAIGPRVLNAGMQLWGGLSVIVVVWTGLQMALAGGGVNMAAVVRTVMGLAIPLGMLQFYSTPLPGTSQSVPELISGMGGWLQVQIMADAGAAYLQQWNAGLSGFTAALGGSDASAGAMVWNAISNPGALVNAAVDTVLTLGVLFVTLFGMLLVFVIGQAQVMWAKLALTIALILGPIFIPWIVIPQLSFLFWGWFRTVLLYSLYGAVAAAVFRITTELGVAVTDGFTNDMVTNPDWTGPAGFGMAVRRGAATVPYLGAALLATFKIGELTQALLSGASAVGSGVGQRAGQAAGFARVAATGGV